VRALLLLGALALASCAPRATAIVRPAAEGTVSFEWTGPADAVFVSGTMTGWAPVELRRTHGRFASALAVPPGRHEYRLEVRVGGALTAVLPPEAERVDDGFGGENGVLRVEGR
jgi:hypothetical protein